MIRFYLSLAIEFIRSNTTKMINKKVNSIEEALQGVESGMTLAVGGFGLSGIPENLIQGLVDKNINNLTPIKKPALITRQAFL